MKLAIIKTIGAYINFLSLFSKEYAASKAINLFATPRKGKISEQEDSYLSKAYKEGIDFDNYEIMTYRWPGKNQTILLAHGWESNASRWEFLIEALKDYNYNIIALDAPGHGNSGSKQFNAILYSEFINEVAKKFNPDIIIGHSVGGLSTIFYQNKYYNNSLKKIIMLGAPSEFESILERYANLLGYSKNVRKAIDQYVENKYANHPSYYSGANFSKKIATQGLIIHDKRDPIIPYKDALLYKDNYPNASLITTEGFGHGLKQEAVANHIVEFITT